MQTTTNLGLRKYELTDGVTQSIGTDQPFNMDTLDVVVYNNQQNIATNDVKFENYRQIPTVGGTANAIVLTSVVGTFDATKNQVITFIPTANNTGAVTIDYDTTLGKSLLKPNGAGGTTALDANDLVNGSPVTIVWSVGSDFFILRPSGGSNIKSIQRGVSTISNAASVTIPISQVNIAKSVVLITPNSTYTGITQAQFYIPEIFFLNSTNIVIETASSTSNTRTFSWQVIEFNNVKSLQVGETNFSNNTSLNISISPVNTSKSILFYSYTCGLTNDDFRSIAVRATLTSNTNINLVSTTSGFTRYVRWQVIEFN